MGAFFIYNITSLVFRFNINMLLGARDGNKETLRERETGAKEKTQERETGAKETSRFPRRLGES